MLGAAMFLSGFCHGVNRSGNAWKVRTRVPNDKDLCLKKSILESDVLVCFLLL